MKYVRKAGAYGNQNPYDAYRKQEPVDTYQESLKKSILQDELSGPKPFFNRGEIMYKDHLMNNYEEAKKETGKLDDVIEQSLQNKIEDFTDATISEIPEEKYQAIREDAIKDGNKWLEIVDDPLAVDNSISEISVQLDKIDKEMYDEHLDTQEFLKNIDEMTGKRRIDNSEVSI